MKRNVNKLFADKLVKIRKERKLSQEKLAHLCNVDRTHIGRIERLERCPSLEIVDRIAAGLGLSLSELLDF